VVKKKKKKTNPQAKKNPQGVRRKEAMKETRSRKGAGNRVPDMKLKR